MSLSVGIVGLPNVGKSTLFNALLKKQQAFVANFPFATIEPNVGIVPVPDRRLEFLAEIIASENYNTQIPNFRQIINSNIQFRNKNKWPPIVPSTVKFVDIAGLIAGASKGEGLGNKFLSHIRETSAICFVLRSFSDPDVIRKGVIDPVTDFEILRLELDLADAETIEAHKKKKNPRTEELPLFSKKPFLVVLNVDEDDLAKSQKIEKEYAEKLKIKQDQIVVISAKVESELSELTDFDQRAYLANLGIEKSGLERLIQKAFRTLGLIAFLTAGEKEVRAWTIKKGTNAQEASGVIHTDFVKKFIKAEVISFEDFVENGGWKGARINGKTRYEGRDYIVQDGDVIEFKIGV